MEDFIITVADDRHAERLMSAIRQHSPFRHFKAALQDWTDAEDAGTASRTNVSAAAPASGSPTPDTDPNPGLPNDPPCAPSIDRSDLRSPESAISVDLARTEASEP